MTSGTHKRLHPFDLHAILNAHPCPEVIMNIGREKVTISARGHETYSQWADVHLVNGEPCTITTTVEPTSDEGKGMMGQYKSQLSAMPPATVTYSDYTITKPGWMYNPNDEATRQRLLSIAIIALCAFSMGLAVAFAVCQATGR